MKVLLVNGSPHAEGCTYTALKIVADTLNAEGVETTIFQLGIDPIAPCRHCCSCGKLGKCVVDDKVNEFLAIAGDYDGYIFGSPVHYASAGGGLSAFLDRVFFADSVGRKGLFKLKPGAAIVSARRAGTTAALDQLNKYFLISQMTIVGSRYWNMVHGMKAEHVLKDEEGCQIMRVLGRNMAYQLKCLEAAKAAGVPLPESEKPIATNFVK